MLRIIEYCLATDIKTGVKVGTRETFSGYVDYIESIYVFAMEIGVSLVALMIIYAGFKYVTSQGNPSAINEAKDIIIGALSGFAMLVLIYFILEILNLPKH